MRHYAERSKTYGSFTNGIDFGSEIQGSEMMGADSAELAVGFAAAGSKMSFWAPLVHPHELWYPGRS